MRSSNRSIGHLKLSLLSNIATISLLRASRPAGHPATSAAQQLDMTNKICMFCVLIGEQHGPRFGITSQLCLPMPYSNIVHASRILYPCTNAWMIPTPAASSLQIIGSPSTCVSSALPDHSSQITTWRIPEHWRIALVMPHEKIQSKLENNTSELLRQDRITALRSLLHKHPISAECTPIFFVSELERIWSDGRQGRRKRDEIWRWAENEVVTMTSSSIKDHSNA